MERDAAPLERAPRFALGWAMLVYAVAVLSLGYPAFGRARPRPGWKGRRLGVSDARWEVVYQSAPPTGARQRPMPHSTMITLVAPVSAGVWWLLRAFAERKPRV